MVSTRRSTQAPQGADEADPWVGPAALVMGSGSPSALPGSSLARRPVASDGAVVVAQGDRQQGDQQREPDDDGDDDDGAQQDVGAAEADWWRRRDAEVA